MVSSENKESWAGPSAKEAGFEVGDIILSINDQPIQGVDTFATMMDCIKPHQKIAIAAVDHRSGNRGVVQAVR